MSDTKRDLAIGVRERRENLLSVLTPQWRKCFWTRPFGHIRDGTRPRPHFGNVCLYCGKVEFASGNSTEKLEHYIAEMGRYPIAREMDKKALA